MPVRGSRINIGAGRIDILGDGSAGEDSPQSAQSPRRKTSFLLWPRDLCGLFGGLVWLRLRRAALPRSDVTKWRVSALTPCGTCLRFVPLCGKAWLTSPPGSSCSLAIGLADSSVSTRNKRYLLKELYSLTTAPNAERSFGDSMRGAE